MNEAESVPLLEDPGEDDPMSSEPQPLASEPKPADADGPQQTEDAALAQDWTGEQRNRSTADADALSVGLTAPVADAAKPPHADEM